MGRWRVMVWNVVLPGALGMAPAAPAQGHVVTPPKLDWITAAHLA